MSIAATLASWIAPIPTGTKWLVGGLVVVLVAAGSAAVGYRAATNAAAAHELERIQAGIQQYKDDDAKNKESIAKLKGKDAEIDKTTSAGVQRDLERLRDDTSRARARVPALRCGPAVTLFGDGNSARSSGDPSGPTKQDAPGAAAEPQVVPSDPIDEVNNDALAMLMALAEKCAAKIELRADALEGAEARNQ